MSAFSRSTRTATRSVHSLAARLDVPARNHDTSSAIATASLTATHFGNGSGARASSRRDTVRSVSTEALQSWSGRYGLWKPKACEELPCPNAARIFVANSFSLSAGSTSTGHILGSMAERPMRSTLAGERRTGGHIEPRRRWPRSSRCAVPRTLVAGQPGDRFAIAVDFHAGRRHRPIVTLKRAA